MDSTQIDRSEQIRLARMRSRSFETLAILFNQKPDAALVRNLKTIGVDLFAQLQVGGELNAEIQAGLSTISRFVTHIQDQPEKDIEQSLQVDWTRLFRGVQRGYGPEPPYEGVYLGENEDDLKVLEAVARFYRSHGVAPSENAGNRLDYIGLEFDFLRYLCEGQAESWEKGDEKAAREWQLAEYDFINDHLGRWAAVYCDRAIQDAKTDFYRGIACLAKGTINEMARNPRLTPDY